MTLTDTPQPLAAEQTVDAETLRRTMGLFATGVTALAAYDEEGEPVAMTANALTSVSLDPLLMLVCVNKQARIMQVLADQEMFSFSIFSELQAPLSNYFAGIWDDKTPPPDFAFEDWHGMPRLANSIAAMGCRKWATYDGGDHWIIVGEVIALHRPLEPGEPLIFYNGLYRTLEELDEEYE